MTLKLPHCSPTSNHWYIPKRSQHNYWHHDEKYLHYVGGVVVRILQRVLGNHVSRSWDKSICLPLHLTCIQPTFDVVPLVLQVGSRSLYGFNFLACRNPSYAVFVRNPGLPHTSWHLISFHLPTMLRGMHFHYKILISLFYLQPLHKFHNIVKT